MKHHIKRNHSNSKESKNMCHICGKSFRSSCHKEELAIHMKMVHNEISKDLISHKCKYCGKEFLRHYYYKKHIEAIHLKETKYECHYDNCKYFAFGKGYLTNHINSVHKQIRNFPCEFPMCLMRFYNNRDKLKHMRKNH